MGNLVVVLFGPPGSGKGTQCVELVKNLNFKHISTGDFVRDEIKNATQFGLYVKELTEKGQYVPDEVLLPEIIKLLNSVGFEQSIILDGFPRTEFQAIKLDEYLETINKKIDLVIELDVPRDIITERLKNRAILEGRPDDKLEVIETRIDMYNTNTASVLRQYYKPKLDIIDGSKTPNYVYLAILNSICHPK
jgi:adenylate kinase